MVEKPQLIVIYHHEMNVQKYFSSNKMLGEVPFFKLK